MDASDLTANHQQVQKRGTQPFKRQRKQDQKYVSNWLRTHSFNVLHSATWYKPNLILLLMQASYFSQLILIHNFLLPSAIWFVIIQSQSSDTAKTCTDLPSSPPSCESLTTILMLVSHPGTVRSNMSGSSYRCQICKQTNNCQRYELCESFMQWPKKMLYSTLPSNTVIVVTFAAVREQR